MQNGILFLSNKKSDIFLRLAVMKALQVQLTLRSIWDISPISVSIHLRSLSLLAGWWRTNHMICIPSLLGSALTVKNKFGRFRSVVTFKRVVEITSFAIYIVLDFRKTVFRTFSRRFFKGGLLTNILSFVTLKYFRIKNIGTKFLSYKKYNVSKHDGLAW